MKDIDEKALEELNKRYSKYELAFAKELLTLITLLVNGSLHDV